MQIRTLILVGVVLAVLAVLGGCANPKKPEIRALNPALPFDQAIDAAIRNDKFLAMYLQPGFERAADGAVESYAVTSDDEGAGVIEHLAALTKGWCGQNGGRVEALPEIPVLQRGVGVVVQQRENRPVSGNAHNLICYKGSDAVAAAAIGRTSYFLGAARFRQAVRDAGASILRLNSL